MQERRRHQRIRFRTPPEIQLGAGGSTGLGKIENLSLSGLMARTPLPLEPGQTAGCEFRLGEASTVDQTVSVVSRQGDLIGLRFQPGIVNPVLLADAMADALSKGQASVLSLHDIDNRRVLRISGGLNESLQEDFLNALTLGKVDVLDLAGVTAVAPAGLALCQTAIDMHGVQLGNVSSVFKRAWAD